MAKMTRYPENANLVTVQFTPEELDKTTGIVVPDETPIIRYMGLSKFYSLINSESMWFPRVDQFSDEYEGLAVLRNTNEAADGFRKASLVSCWNYFTSESFPLWKIYLGNEPAGVAVVSTVGDFKASIKDKKERGFLTSFQVQYVPHDEEYDGINNMLLVTRKKQFYEYENEIRFNYYNGNLDQPVGKSIALNPEVMINKIILSPYMPDWILSTFKGILEKYDLAHLPIESSIVRDSMLKG